MMKTPFLLVAALTGVVSVQANVLMLDFGPTVATGTSLTNSPYHSVTPAFVGSTWNTVGITDINSGLLLANNTAATGVTLNLGSSTSSTINVATNPNNGTSVTGTQIATTGVYGGTSVGRDAIFQNTTDAKVGLQIGGLTAGLYDVYVIARNTNLQNINNAGSIQTIYAGTSAAAGNFDFSSYASTALTYPGNQQATINTATWVQGGNYARFTVNLGAGEVLNLAVSGSGAETRGFLNAVQIVAVPEPATYGAAMTVGLIALVIIRRRRAMH